MNKQDEFSITLVGAGNMGGAMLGGWLANGFAASAITVIDPSPPDHMASMIAKAGVHHLFSAPENLASEVLVLAVKPQIIGKVMANVQHLADENTVCVSVAAGTTISQLQTGLGGKPAIVRAMPNTPSLVRRGITVACPNNRVDERQRNRVDRLLKATGIVVWIDDESLMDAVTAVSGSGPAYVFHLTECMAAAGIKAGLPEKLAMQLARETVSGAAELMARSNETPAQLRENVTSPNGTTAAALEVLMGNRRLGELMEEAVAAARNRASELSE
jgi:pyrroline-5-carboxylate reductase